MPPDEKAGASSPHSKRYARSGTARDSGHRYPLGAGLSRTVNPASTKICGTLILVGKEKTLAAC